VSATGCNCSLTLERSTVIQLCLLLPTRAAGLAGVPGFGGKLSGRGLPGRGLTEGRAAGIGRGGTTFGFSSTGSEGGSGLLSCDGGGGGGCEGVCSEGLLAEGGGNGLLLAVGGEGGACSGVWLAIGLELPGGNVLDVWIPGGGGAG